MSTWFDAAVYAMRKNAPFSLPMVTAFMRSRLEEIESEEVIFKAEYRREVASRIWWTMKWTEAGQERSTSGQTWDLCLWRAIQKSKELARARELETHVGNPWFVANCNGFEAGDGI